MFEISPNMLVIPFSGAAIGLFTNWIALKMLFRPHNEKRFLGFRLPFTPGVMPKRRADLAQKLGFTVGEHILTGEVLSSAMTSPENVQKLRLHLGSAIDSLVEDARSSGLCVEEFVRVKLPGGGALIDVAAERAAGALKTLLGSQTFRAELVRLLHEQIVSYVESGALQRKFAEFLADNSRILSARLKNLHDEQAIPDSLMNSGTPISEHLARWQDCLCENLEAAQADLSAAAAKHLPVILADILRDNKALDEKLESLTRQVINDSLSSVTRMFVNPAKVYASIKENALNFLSNEEGVRELAGDAISGVSAWLRRPVGCGGAFDSLPLLRTHIGGLVERFADFLLDEAQSLCFADLLDSYFPSYRAELLDHMENRAETTAAAMSEFTASYIESKKSELLQSRVSNIAWSLRDDDIERLKAAIFELAEKAPESLAPLVAESINISGLVEDQINAFDIAKVEFLVISVIRRELGVVVALGGVLGFAIGLVAMLAQGVAL